MSHYQLQWQQATDGESDRKKVNKIDFDNLLVDESDDELREGLMDRKELE